jgi:hypothetical protein
MFLLHNIRDTTHAFRTRPKDWFAGELVLVSKNRLDCSFGERQIQYVMRIRDIRRPKAGEISQYWPGNEGRWSWIVDCADTHRLRKPFNLRDVIKDMADSYDPVMTFKKFTAGDEQKLRHLMQTSDADAIGSD